jgi:hypothetical protein
MMKAVALSLKVRFFILFMALFICPNSSFRQPIHNKFRLSNTIIAKPKFCGRKSTIVRLVDPNAVDTMYQASTVAADSFLNSFVARTIGAIVGNVLSAVVFKYVSDIIFKKNEPEAVKQPERVLKTADISQTAWIQLLFCIMIDLGSDASFLIPGIGELEDVAWAPISAYLLNLVFGSSAISTLEFAKEILPGTDILPVATFAWLLQNIFTDSPLTGALGLKKEDIKKVIDVKGESVSPDIDAWDDKFKDRR